MVDKEDRCLLMFDRTLYQIDSNSAFNALMFAKTDLIAVQQQGKVGQVTPATPNALSVVAPIVPATCVP